MLERVEFGQKAITYIREQLRRGNRLAQNLLSLELETGHAISYLPTGLDPAIAQIFHGSIQFNTGIRLKANVIPIVIGIMQDHLHLDSKRCVVIETYYKPTDMLNAVDEPFYFRIDSEVYYFLHSFKDGEEKISKALSSARDYPFIAALTSLEVGEPEITLGHIVGKKLLERLATRASKLIIGAYDGDGFLIWERA